MMMVDVLQRRSLFHCIHPSAKIAWLILLALTVPLLQEPLRLLVIAGAVWVLVIVVARVPPKFLLRHALLILLVPSGLLLFHSLAGDEPLARVAFITLTRDGGRRGAMYFLQFSTIIVASLLFVWTTTPGAVLGALRQLRVPYRLAFLVYLGLRLVPVVTDDIEDIRLAHRLRYPHRPWFVSRLALWRRFLATAVLTALGRADLLAASMDLRGFSRPGPRTLADPPRLQWWHLALPGAFAVVSFAGLCAYRGSSMITDTSKGRTAPWWRYTTRDLIVIAVLSVVAAVAYAGLGQLWAALTTAAGPLGGAFLGLFQFGHLIAFAVVQRPGCAFVTSVTSTVIQAFLGDPAGIYVIGWGVTHGIGAEAIFAASRYRAPSWWVLGLAAGVGAVCGHLWSYALYGWEAAMSLFYASIPILFVSSAVESGLLAYAVYKIVTRATHRA